MPTRSKSCLVCAMIASLMPAIAQADPTLVKRSVSSIYGDPPLFANFSTFEGGSGEHIRQAGTFHLRSEELGDFVAFCIELPQDLALPEVYNQVVSPFSAADTDALSRLFTGFYEGIDTGIEAAAFQAAVWEIINDDVFDLGAGDFQQLSNPGVKILAMTYLASLSDFEAGYDLTFLHSPVSQDLITAVPIFAYNGS